MRFFKTLKAKKSRMIAGLITASMLFSSVPTTLLADDKVDDPEVIGTSSFEVVVEDQESVESTETVVDENVTSIPADETEPTDVVVEPSEEPPIETSVKEPSEETLPEETEVVDPTTEETTVETTVEPTTEETATTEETTEPTEESTEPERWENMTYVDSQDAFIDTVAVLPDDYRLIIVTDENIDNAFQITSGVYFDGAYIVSFSDAESLDEAISYLNANSIDYARDGQMTINGSFISSTTAITKIESGKRVAIIDTGSNSADEVYSVIGESGADSNGHGTQMTDIVKASGATVISIQALGADGKGQITDVYNAIQLANTLDVDYILMSISTRDVGSYSVFKDLVSETISSGTKVVASAGNNNRDASLYMPANISGVITVGALNEDLTKLDVSNYGSVVDFYVVASSTSEAAAKYIALEGTDAVYSNYLESPIVSIPDDNDVFIDVDEDGNFFICAWGSAHYNYGLTFTLPAGTTLVGKEGTYTEEGTCNFTDDPNNGGAGWITSCTPNSTTGLGFNLQNIINSYGRIAIECGAHNSLDSSSQRALAISSGTREYKVEYRVTKSGNTYSLEGDIYLCTSGSKDGWRSRSWSSITGTWSAKLVDWNSNVYFYDITVSYGPSGSSSNHHTVTRTRVSMPAGNSSARAGYLKGEIAAVVSNALNNGYSGYRGGSAPNYSTKPTSSAVTVSGSVGSSGTSNGSFSLSSSYQGTGQTQVYRQQVLASETRILTGDMVSVQYSNKNSTNLANQTYTLSYRGDSYNNGTIKTYTATTNASGVATFSGSDYPLGWYYLPLKNDSGSLYICLFDYNGVCYKSIYRSHNGNYPGDIGLTDGGHQGAATPYTFTMTDYPGGLPTSGQVRPSNIDNTHSVDVNNTGKWLTNTTFCIQPFAPYTQTPTGWSNYRSVADSMGSSLRSILGNTPMGKITGANDNAKAANLCKILYYSGYNLDQKQNYMWYVMNQSSTGNLNVPTYTATRVSKGNTNTPFNNVTYNGNKLANGATINVSSLGQVILNTNNANFNTTNYQVSVTGCDGKITAAINNSQHTIILTFANDISASQIRNAKITITNKVDIDANGAPATSVEYYAFSVANNNNSQQTRFTGYYYLELPYYTASFNVKLDAHQDIKIKKASSNPLITDGNSCYDLAGTTYEIYSTVADARNKTNRLGVFTVDSNGNVNNVFPTRDFSRNYYIREITAGKGYLLNDTIYTVTIGANPSIAPVVDNGISVTKDGDVYVINLKDEPGNDPLRISLQKVDETGQPKEANFYGTTFRLAYYAQDLGTSGTSNEPTVVYDIVLSAQNTTIVNGKVRLIITLDMLRSLAPVDGMGSNPNYFNNIPSNWDEFPFGTFRLWETVAAPGFRVNNQVIRFRLGRDLTLAEKKPIIENTASDGEGYWTGTTLTQDGEYELLLEEFESEGYYSLTKTLDDYYVSNGNNNYEYEVWNMSSGDSPIKIATGVSQADGKVLWTYVAPDYYSNKKVDGQRVKLTGTKTYNLELPAEELAANGSRTRIQYQVRELCSSIAKKYGTTNIPYTYSAPKTGGVEWALSADKAYYYRNIQVSPNTNPANANHDDVVNNDEWTNIGLTKALTDHDNFDRVYDMVNNLTFYLYNTDSNVLIATGSPVLVKDANGDVTSITVNWTRQHTSGYGITRGSATGEYTSTNYNLVNEATTLHYLPLGNYRIEERWTRAYLDTLDNSERIEIEATNNANGWTLDDTNTSYVRYYQNVAATTDEHNYNFGAVNDVHDQWFNAAKSVTVAGDASTVKYELYYKEGNTYKKVATGTANVTGTVGTIYPVTWTYNGLHATKKIGGVDADTIALLEGDYRLVELIPETYYANGKTNVPYTYMCPAGFNVMWKNSEHTIADYFYRDFHATNSETSIISRQVTNTRIEGEITINKSAEVTTADYDFDFAIFYRGNGLEAENVGKFDGKDPLSLTKENVKDISSYLDTLTVHVVAGSGKATTIRVPEGWYEIVEIDAAGWAPKWYNNDTTTSQNHKIVHVDSNGLIDSEPIADDGVMLFGVDFEGAVIMNNVSVRLILHKLDAWTKSRLTEIVGDPNSPYIHLTFYLYEDGNANGVIDNDEMAIWTAGGDIDDDATVYFKNLGIGHYVVREVATVNGYYLTAADYAFVVDGPTDVEHDMENSPYCEPVLVHKLDNETHEPLEGAQFDVFVDVNNNGTYESDIDTPAQAWVDADEDLIVDDGEVVDCTFTFENGAYKSNGGLHFNDGDVFGSQYLLVELSAPANYFFVDADGNFTTENTVVAFKVEKRSTTATDFQVTPKEFTLYNQTGSVFVNKVDEKTHEFLAGAEFTIYSDEACTNAVATFDDSSVVEINGVKYYHYKGLYLGDYYLVETDAPEYYETDNNVYPFSITLEGTSNGLGDGTHPVVDNKTWEVIPGVAGEFINHNPIIKTTLVDKDTQEHVVAVKDTITLVDTVEYSGLHVGETYIMHGELYDAETGTSLGITAEKQFVPETTSGTVDVEFEFAYEYVKEFTFVASEVCENVSRGKNVGIHFDINDTFQTVYGPEIHTTLLDTVTDDHVAPQNEETVLVDTVKYTNLAVGLEYTMHGTLMNAETGEPMLDDDGKEITAEYTWTPTEKDGFVELTFKFASKLLTGETMVAFEELTYKDITVATHNDLTDRDQTVDIPEIKTTFFDKDLAEVDDFENAKVGEKVTLIDTVHYENLTLLDKDEEKIEYTLRGTIMIKETNKPLTDEDGNPVEFTKTFVPTASTGDVDVEFTVDTTKLQGKTLVAFETLEYKGITLVIHADINDNDQTVHVPEIHTKATDKVDGDNVIDGRQHEQTIVDTVSYTNLIPGKTYVMTGKLVVKKDYKEGEALEYVTDANGKVIEVSTEFTPETANGTVDVEFTIDASKYAGKKLVAFETLTYEGIELTVHTDIEDKEQTITVSLLLHVKIAKADKDNIAYYLKDAEITIFYAELDENGEFKKDADGNVIYTVAKDAEGKDCVAVTDENGEVNFLIDYDENKVYYAQETKAPAGYNINPDKFEVTVTEDRETEGVCLITINILDAIIIIPPKTGDNMNIGLYIAISVIAVLGIAGGCFFLLKKKEDKSAEEKSEEKSEDKTEE